MQTKRIITTGLVVIVGIVGIMVGLVLVKERQDIQERAAVEAGNASVSLNPGSGNYDVGDTISVSVYFNTDGIAISGVATQLVYPFSGPTPEILAGNIQINPSFLSSGDWSCPTLEISESVGNVVIDISCANISASGFTSTTDTLLATFDLIVDQVPSNNPTVMVFDPVGSRISDMTGLDILLIPSTEGTYTIGQIQATVTPTSSATSTPMPTSFATATSTPTIALEVTATASPTPTTSTLTSTPSTSATPTPAELLDAGVSAPTIVGLGLGLFTLLAAVALAL